MRQRNVSPGGVLQDSVRTEVRLQPINAHLEGLQGKEIAPMEESLKKNARPDQQNSIISAAFTLLKRENQGPAKILQYYDDHV